MFWKNKFRLFESINIEHLKEKRYYNDDCGCRKEYELICVEVNPKGNTYVVKTTLFRKAGDWMAKSLQSIWDDKKIQKNLKKAKEDEDKGKEQEYKPTIYRELTKQDYRNALLAYTIFYKWAKENLKDDYSLDKVIGVINALDFAYRGVANVWNSLHTNDHNTIENLELRIASLTMSKEQYKKFYDSYLNGKFSEREIKEKEILKGLICHKCEIPMEEITTKHAFEGEGHHCPAWLRGKKCAKCGFTIFLPKDIEHYMTENRLHFLVYGGSDAWLKKNEKILTKEIKGMVKEYRENSKRFDDSWKTRRVREKKILESLRKHGEKSKYFETS